MYYKARKGLWWQKIIIMNDILEIIGNVLFLGLIFALFYIAIHIGCPC